MKVRKGLNSDIREVLQLEYRLYPEQWHVPEEIIRKVLARNEEVIRVLETNGALKGHYAFLPLEKDVYEKVLHGTLDEKELADYIVDYKEPKDIYLYWTTVMVDTEDTNRSQFSKCLLNDIPLYLKSLQERGINIVEIGGIFISDNGVRVAQRFGMVQTGTIYYAGKSYPVYRTATIH
ncbi:hypothetical protein M3221_20470 [Domibacillus indicus]|uniref:hypothetical protein n=1 Tax=Domibacillus indicus TaxID=1437523 RepID=UPI00203D11F4|nr:hypothetical protein [Domibacillus indicus]MCM3790725.1 hypothetical protein [Domibacillus indicus]